MSTLDWRELKKELFVSPLRPRTSKTFTHSDVFGARDTTEVHNKMNPTDQGTIGQMKYKTPKKVRENDTTRSFVLDKSDQKKEYPKPAAGKRTFQHAKTINFQSSTYKPQKSSAHKLNDHKGEWFFDQTNEKRRNLQSVKQDNSRSVSSLNKKQHPPNQMKQEELFRTEIGQVCLYPDGQTLNLQPRSRSQFEVANDLDRCRSPDRTHIEMRLLHNESNIFNDEQFQPKVQLPIAHRRQNTNYESHKVEPQPQDTYVPEEVCQIKRLNHNFSDVFGLEYGAREPLQVKKQYARELSPTLVWTQIDSILNDKDLGSKHKAKQGLIKQRSRVMDQKSTLDQHDEYSKPIPKTDRLQTRKAPIQRNQQKKKKWG